MNKLAYLNSMLKKSIILFENNGFDLSGIKENINLQCRGVRKKIDGYYQVIDDNNFDLNEENNYRYYPNREIHIIVISSKIDNGLRAAETLIHELCHAVQYELHGYDCQPHGKEFKAIAFSVGLDGSRPTTTPALPVLEAQIEEWEVELGTYPHPVSMPKKMKILEVIGSFVLNLFFLLYLIFIVGSVSIIIYNVYEYFLG